MKEILEDLWDTHVAAFMDIVIHRRVSLDNDPVAYLKLIREGESRCYLGNRVKMSAALLKDGVISKEAAVLLSEPAEKGYLYCVIDWGSETSTVLVQFCERGRCPHKGRKKDV